MVAEPDDMKVIRLIRELDAERVARCKAERHAKMSAAYAARLQRQITTADASAPRRSSSEPRRS